MAIWNVEIRGTITRDIRWIKVEAESMGDAMVRAVELHPTYRAKSAVDDALVDDYRMEFARMLAVVHGLEVLTEGQLANIIAKDLVAIRELIDDGRAHLMESPLTGQNGKHIMKRLGLE